MSCFEYMKAFGDVCLSYNLRCLYNEFIWRYDGLEKQWIRLPFDG